MTKKELIRRALMGNKQAQKECTEKGIVLPCPLCGSDGSKIKLNFDFATSTAWTKCQGCGVTYSIHTFGMEEEERDFYLINDWNTRPAPPIGRCEDCKWYECGKEWYPYCNHPDGLANSVRATDFCCCFEPREE